MKAKQNSRIEETACDPVWRRKRGFMLMETLIAFAVFSVAASIMLEQLYVLAKYTERAFAQQRNVTELVNRANLFPTTDWTRVSIQLSEQEIELSLQNERQRTDKIAVRNYAYDSVDLPVSVAYAPFQVFNFGGDGEFALRLLQPGLLPASSASTTIIGR